MDPLSVVGTLSFASKISFATVRLLREDRSDGAIIVLSFRALQAQRIDEMQIKLHELSVRKLARPAQPPLESLQALQSWQRLDAEIDQYLQGYANALRDYETLSQEKLDDLVPTAIQPGVSSWARRFRKNDVNHEMDSLREMMKEGKLKTLYNFRELDQDGRLRREKAKASSERLWMGIFGGVTLITPMLIMVLHRSLNTSLIVSSISTVLFALALALAARSLRGMDVLAATAAYAAVLVVFVGTSMAPVS
ncbi:uncharacterized protein PAC_14948 [Phialocephala subalpina]|uniref:DUF6594 domain-containing protein n=1 Tax=Phialocephala subalpina TaxID=576137 RepID=A0A1L7XJ60_9HELO|nr:uncharacterized protein PAC_14948 [Phialocephala subalpina]